MFNANMPSLSDIAAVTGDRDWGGNGWWIIIILLAMWGGFGGYGWGANGGYGNGGGYVATAALKRTSPSGSARSKSTTYHIHNSSRTSGINSRCHPSALPAA